MNRHITPDFISNKKITLQWITISILAILIIILFGLHFLKNDRVVYVDSAKVLSEYKGAKDARGSYEKKAKSWQSNIDTLTQGLQANIKKYEKDLAKMSPKEAQLSRQLIGNQQKQLQDYQRAIQNNAQQEDGKLTQTVVTEINSFLQEYGKSKNYKYILIASQSGTIAYAREGLDITGEVIEALNSNYDGKKP